MERRPDRSVQPTILHDRIDPARAEALMATLGRSHESLGVGDALPPYFHHLYFWDPAWPEQIGEDGHRHEPDHPGLWRMWAGGRVTWHTSFCAGIAAQKSTTVKEVSRKQGRSGPLVFVTLAHTVAQRGQAVLSEEQTLVYRSERGATSGPDAVGPTARNSESRDPLNFDVVTLFRYSALTFNAHRIHFDADYCREIAGYPGLVVHGPLMAQRLALCLFDRLGPLAQFSYRALAPLFLGTAAQLCASGQDAWIEDEAGRICMTAAARPA